MRKVLLFLSFFFVLSALIRAQELNQVDDKGLKHGKWRKTFENGVIKYEGQFRNNRPFGEFRYYYETAELKTIMTFSDDGVIAYSRSFHANGKLMAQGKYINQQKDSTWTFFSDIDGKLIIREDYIDGRKHGKSILYFPDNEQVAEVTEFKMGIKDGEYLKCFPDGRIMTKTTYQNNSLHGDFTVFYNSGAIEIKGKYLNGEKSGNWEYFSEDGKALTEEQYKQEMID